MDALRQHPFFAGIKWLTLWSDPVPPIESGLVKKEATPSDNGYDVGVAWEQLVGSVDDSSENNVPWIEDDGSFATNAGIVNGYPFSGGGGEIGPLDIVPTPQSTTLTVDSINAIEADEMRGRPGLPTTSSNTLVNNTSQKVSHPIDIPSREDPVLRSSIISSGSGTSSSEGSPVGRLNAAMETLAVNAEPDRGRDRATTPIQLTMPPDAQWSALLTPGENLVFHAPVELKSRTRRLTATLIPIPATQNRPKIRHLVLTTQRLVCVKLKHGRKLSVKNEALLRSPSLSAGKDFFRRDEKKDSKKDEKRDDKKEDKKEDKREREKERDPRPVITSVSPKGQRAFVIMTVRPKLSSLLLKFFYLTITCAILDGKASAICNRTVNGPEMDCGNFQTHQASRDSNKWLICPCNQVSSTLTN